jgi:hypothetical protein
MVFVGVVCHADVITPIPIEDFDEQANTGKVHGTFCVAEVLPSGLERYVW